MLAPLLARQASTPENPRKQLPISARPPMLPGGRGFVMRREVIEKLGVCRQSGPRENALEKIVAKQGVVSYLAHESFFERVDVVDSFAGVRTLAEQILVNVGSGGCVRVNAARPGKHFLEKRTFSLRRQGGSNARLDNSVPVHNAFFGLTELGHDSRGAPSSRSSGRPRLEAIACLRQA